MRRKTAIIGLLFVVGCGWLLSSCGSGKPKIDAGAVVLEEEPPAEALATAQETAEAFGKQLVAALFRELEGGNPIEAIEVCAVVAQEIAASYATEGITVRRVSRRVRNPADEPDAYERVKLEELQGLHDRGSLPSETAEVVMQSGAKRLRYLKPIVVKQPCLMCHGPVGQIDDEVLDTIHRRYPGDRAIGYEVDDLRGAISVTIPL
jgi:hypothetical protein